jgi:hypothetical protein
MRVARSLIAGGLLMTALVIGGGVAAAFGSRVAPHQHFTGFVNGKNTAAVIRTVCPGPAGGTGRVSSGQTVSVRLNRGGAGYTGPFSQIYAWVVPPTGSTSRPEQVTFRSYGTLALPTTIQVPCQGRGQVEFSSCPYLAPCAYGWVPTYVDVAFENPAVSPPATG